MSFERWGSLSVIDHNDTAALVADVLLYDRLVFPVMAPVIDAEEANQWKKWDSNLQAKRMDDLQELAIRRPWSAARREFFKNRKAELIAENKDAAIIDSYHITRMILAQEQVVDKPPGVHHVDVIAAYDSAAGLGQDFQLSDDPKKKVAEHVAAQAVLLTRRLAIPDLPNVEESFKLAIDLSRDDEFRSRRADLFEFQERMAAKQVAPADAVEELSQMADKYNAAVRAANAKVRWKLAFMVAGVGLAFAGGFTALAGASAALAVVKFTMLDDSPVIEAGSAKPFAMFHDIEATIGAKLKPQG